MGVGTLFGWKKTSPAALRRACIAPLSAMIVMGTLHLVIGKSLGFPAIVWGDSIYGGALGAALRAFNAFTPLIGFSLCVFNATIIIQEFVLLFRARKRTGVGKDGAWLWPVGFVFSVIAVFGSRAHAKVLS